MNDNDRKFINAVSESCDTILNKLKTNDETHKAIGESFIKQDDRIRFLETEYLELLREFKQVKLIVFILGIGILIGEVVRYGII